ncbi:hypothetical protein G6O69_11560 [Pseudenhygromyxa sp. WMMC2535]|uniref:hypothetical protein n=1 Tax=Pseudenhygromyxa sp. WMMC2535 TaxID=2712867 RepID=UPI0015519405|nr:hypothetical protein [Pseudenhygromyxa sp. WMMC2535]NVB38470.1 hypothetical protein [Pseudenhygromyxa sp. WMMC2535]
MRRFDPRLVLCALAFVVALGGCARKESEPVAVARAFAESARRGDVEAMMAVLERPAVERLEQAAERASDQVGGRRNIEPAEMLQIVAVDRSVAVASAELVDQSERLAHVELETTDGRSIRVELVWEPLEPADAASPAPAEGEVREGSWKVRVPLPGPEAASPQL